VGLNLSAQVADRGLDPPEQWTRPLPGRLLARRVERGTCLVEPLQCREGIGPEECESRHPELAVGVRGVLHREARIDDRQRFLRLSIAKRELGAGEPDAPLAEGECGRVHGTELAHTAQSRPVLEHLDRTGHVPRATAGDRERRRRPAHPHSRSEAARDPVRRLELLERGMRREQVEHHLPEQPAVRRGPLQVASLLGQLQRLARHRQRAIVLPAPAQAVAHDEAQERLAGAPADLARDPDRPG